MQSSPSDTPPVATGGLPLFDPVLLGTACGLLSAVGYTAANICLRQVAHCDPVWVSGIKAFPTVVLFGPWLLAQAARRENIMPSGKVMVALILAAVFGQIAGNVTFQWALGVIGIAMSVPLVLGTMIIGGAILGRVFLHEPVTPRMALSIGVLIAAVSILRLGARQAHESMTGGTEASVLLLTAGVAAASLCGVAYAVLGVVIRYAVTRSMPLSTTLVTVGLVGVLLFGPASVYRQGAAALWNTPWDELSMMLQAGFYNALAFLALTKSLQLTKVVYVNALNATQVAMAAVAGVVLFGEAVTAALVVGATMSVGGLLLMKGRRAPSQAKAPAPQKSAASPASEPASPEVPARAYVTDAERS